jgi:hypothetical protein
VRRLVTCLAPAPLLFLAAFLLSAPVRTLVGARDAALPVVDPGPGPVPVIVVVFDELPLGALLDPAGGIDAARFPGFARLAAASTWYPRAASVALHTHMAIAAIATGLLPERAPLGVATRHPRSLFTLLAGSHDLHVVETLTRLCPRDACRPPGPGAGPAGLARDLAVVYLHILLSGNASRWGVPAIDDRWAGFGDGAPWLPRSEAALGAALYQQAAAQLRQDQVASFEAFLATLGQGHPPGFWFLHSLLPHRPYRWLPDGRRYEGEIAGLADDLVWSAQPGLAEVGAQRLVLQLMHVDGLVGRLLDRLQAIGLFEPALLVVIADHGAVFQPGRHFRAFPPQGVGEGDEHEVLPVPLFVKYPHQVTGAVDDRHARTVDVVPTVVEALGIRPPGAWRFDGRSLLGPPLRDRPYRVVEDGEHAARTIADPVDARRMARRLHDLLGPGGGPHDGFRLGPHGGLVGQPVAALPRGPGLRSVRPDHPAAYRDVHLDGIVPALFEATLSGVHPGGWVAVALDGTIAGVGPTYRRDAETRVVAMLDPSLMVGGANHVSVHPIEGPDGDADETVDGTAGAGAGSSRPRGSSPRAGPGARLDARR